MKVVIERDSLLDALNIVIKGMSSRSTLDILSGILLSTKENCISLQTTDLEISIYTEQDAQIIESGEVLISGKLFYDIIKNFSSAAVTLTYNFSQLTIECLDSKFNISTMNAEDFPSFPQTQTLQSVKIPTAQINKMVKKTTKAVSKDESRAILTGIFMKVEDKKVSLVSTDSYRLSICEVELEESFPLGFEVIIPGNSFDEVSKLAINEKEIEIGESTNQIVFKFGKSIFITRKIEGNYPNYNQIIPKEKSISVEIETATLLAAVKRIAVLNQSHLPLTIKFTFSQVKQSLLLSSTSQENGAAEEKIPVKIEGGDLEIGFNHQFILDGLSSISTDTFTFEALDPQKPGIFTITTEDEFFFYLTMPVRIDR